MTSAPAVRLRGVTKRYPRVVANRGVSLEVARGEVHALVGENGAGKSTLMKILYGAVTPDAGTVEVCGRRLTRHTSAEAIAAGVGMVFQHFMLVGPLSVAENMVLGREPRRAGVLFDRAHAEEEVRALSVRYGLPIDPRAAVETLPVGLQQRVEILKVLLRGAEVIVLDEPTAVLTPQETDELLEVVRALAASGKTIVLITHKLREVMAASDRVTVMRRGEVVATRATAETSADELARLMVGRDLDAPSRPEPRERGEPALAARGLVCHAADRGAPALLAGLDLEVRAGEIVGLAGIEGNGQRELVECLVGVRRAAEGSVWLAGRDVTRASPRARLDAGLAHIAADRHRDGVVLPFTLAENAALGRQWHARYSAPGRLRRAALRADTAALLERCDVRPPDPDARMQQLSGGNQQKVVVGRELARAPRALIAAHPTRGLDVGAIAFVHQALLAERARGVGVLLISAELPEILQLADRVLVIHGGRIAGEVDPQEADERELGLLMAGGA